MSCVNTNYVALGILSRGTSCEKSSVIVIVLSIDWIASPDWLSLT